MKRLASFTASAALAIAALSAYADEHEGEPSYSPVETYTCHFNEGLGPGDLDETVEAWNAFMDDKGIGTYFAATITPHYFGPDSFDFAWMGVWPDGAAMGEGTDMWLAEGREFMARFAAVADCDTHSNFVSATVKEPPSEIPPDTIVMSVADCNLRDGKTMDEAMSGMAEFAALQSAAGMDGGIWVWWPVYGGGGADFDFKLVEGFPNHATLGKLYDWYGNGGAYVQWDEHIGSAVSCDDSRVYNGTVRRRMQQD